MVISVCFKPNHHRKLIKNLALFFSAGFKRAANMNDRFCADIKLAHTRIGKYLLKVLVACLTLTFGNFC